MKENAAARPRVNHLDVEIKQRPGEVVAFLDSVRSLADEGRDSLGFLPVQVYEDAAKAGNLYVAVSGEKQSKFCGYVLFGGTFPNAKIFQVSVLRSTRGLGIGKLLVNTVVNVMEQKGYMSVYAKVADDLKENDFWQKLQFFTVIQKPGGITRKRQINIRLRELNTPSLFRTPIKERVLHLPLRDRTASRPAVYVIDLNVFFDVVKRRPRVETAGRVFAAGFKNLVRVVVAEEFISELRRSSKPNPTDPVLELAMQLPTISMPNVEWAAQTIPKLASIVFPYRQNNLSTQDRSNLIHLATAIYHSATGFVTSEKAIVEAAPRLRALFGVEVADAQQFGQSVERVENSITTVYARLGANHLRLVPLTPELKPALVALSDLLGVTEAIQGPNQQSLVALINERIVAAIIWSCSDPLERVFSGTIVADEDHPAVETALDAILYRFSREATKGGPARLRLYIPRGQMITLQTANEHGFREIAADKEGRKVVKRISFGGPVLPEKWQEFRSQMEKLSEFRLQERPPDYTSFDAPLTFEDQDGKKQEIGLSDLESNLSPICLIVPGRTGVIVPIQPQYADELLGTSRQGSLLPGNVATLFPQRTYYSTARNARLLSRGTVIVFYESAGDSGKGRSSVIAFARIISTTVVSKAEVPEVQLKHGVLDVDGVQSITAGEMIGITIFDNVIEIPKPMSLKQLQQLRCDDGTHFVSAREITADQLASIAKNWWGA